jgi:2-oxoglutarate/2-oxoacid ferredoxin oxidoreductase subunit beta
MKTNFDRHNKDIAWCAGCGNFSILECVKTALEEIGCDKKNLVFVSGIGQAAKAPQYIDCHFFNGLHGRALPVATGIKASNPALTVIVESGDGDMYGEGGNHFIHTIRRNVNITNIVHNNMVYGLTKGQASPTSQKGFVTPVQTNGVILEPFNPVALALALDATFIARAFAGDKKETIEILKKAIDHKGYALVDILQPCVTFNSVNTYPWYKENTYYIDPEEYPPTNRNIAFDLATRNDKLALGIFYINTSRPTFEEQLGLYKKTKDPLYKRKSGISAVKKYLKKKYVKESA